MSTLKNSDKVMMYAAYGLGKDLYPEFQTKAVLLDPHPKLAGFMLALGEKNGFSNDLKIREWATCLPDPWTKAVAELGYEFPKRGMATYFANYILSVAMVAEVDTLRARMGLASLSRRIWPTDLRVLTFAIGRRVAGVYQKTAQYQIGYLSLMEELAAEEYMPNGEDYKFLRNAADDFITNSRKHPGVLEWSKEPAGGRRENDLDTL